MTKSLQLRSLVKANGTLEVSLFEVPTPTPAADEVLVRVEAAPINPSDLGLLFAGADIGKAVVSGTASRPVVTVPLSAKEQAALASRREKSLPVGNEGAGVVVAAGSHPAAQALLGKTVAILGGAMYAQHRAVNVAQCLELPAGTTPAEGASSFVNPLTALGMVETMRLEGHKGLVHTAAASNLGQMLNRICIQDGVPLVNIVRSGEQAQLLRASGATYVCDSTSASFKADLTAALIATGATLAFDAIGGGQLAGDILNCMEAAINAKAEGHSVYGSSTLKQVYIYGGLDQAPTELVRNFGMTWSMGGWLLFPFLQRIGPAATAALKARVARELKTTFASHYSQEVALAEALQPAAIAAYAKRATGTKFLLCPNKGIGDV